MHIMHISRYSDFLWVVLINTEIFLLGLKLCKEGRTKQVILVSKEKIGGNHAFFRDNEAAWLLPIFFLDFNNTC